MGEIISGSVTLKSVRRLLAPPTRAASSSVESMLRNAGVRSITLIEMPCPIRLAQTMPGTLKMLNGPCSRPSKFLSATLIMPTSGSNSVIHAMVVGRAGTMYETQNENSSAWLKGILVRARIHAMVTPTGKLMTTESDQISSELPSDLSNPGRLNALIQ